MGWDGQGQGGGGGGDLRDLQQEQPLARDCSECPHAAQRAILLHIALKKQLPTLRLLTRKLALVLRTRCHIASRKRLNCSKEPGLAVVRTSPCGCARCALL
jgi:hypothetical protein